MQERVASGIEGWHEVGDGVGDRARDLELGLRHLRAGGIEGDPEAQLTLLAQDEKGALAAGDLMVTLSTDQ